MGHTYANLIYHLVFSTKERRALLSQEVLERLIPFVGGVVRHRKGKLLAMNGTENHVHLLASIGPAAALSDQVRDIKALSSGWVRDVWPALRLFGWQSGYAAFTVSVQTLGSVIGYIEKQRAHHRRRTFEEELIAMLERAGVEYDPEYVFD